MLNAVLAVTLLYKFNYFWERERDAAKALTERRRLQVENMDWRPADIVFIGDSLIAEGMWSYWFPDRDIANLGVPGSIIGNIYYRGHQLKWSDPKQIFVMVGINDLNFSSLTLDLDAAIKAYGLLLDRIAVEAPAASVYVHKVLPTNATWIRAFSLEDLRPLNAFIEDAARQRGYHVIDLAARMADAGGHLDPALTDDGLHLNADGYRIWIDTLRPLLYSTQDEPS